MTAIFVFGSNLAGVHGAGSARHALEHCGAVWGQGVGRTGNAYAIPTKDQHVESMRIEEIAPYVAEFLDYARRHPELTFEIVAIGCGLAGFTPDQMAPMFRRAPDNCRLPPEFVEQVSGTE